MSITSARTISIPTVIPAMIFESLGELNHFKRSRVPFSLYPTDVLLPYFSFPEPSRPTRLVHLENTERKRMNTQVIHFSRGCKEQLFRARSTLGVNDYASPGARYL